MRHLRQNLLVQFSVVSFVIMFALAFSITTIIANQLSHNVEDMKVHNTAMMMGAFDPTPDNTAMEDVTNNMPNDAMDPTDGPTMMVDVMDEAHPASIPHIITNVSNLRLITVGTIAGGFVILYLSLLSIVWAAWRTITRQQHSIARTNEELKAYTVKLESSNHEWEDLASGAAHDLQEPLRKVHGFSSRLRG